jgi:isocitrate lyase
MNLIQELERDVKREFFHAVMKITEPRDPNGMWWLDISHEDKVLAVQWSQRWGFGVSDMKSDVGYGEGPDNVFKSPHTVKEFVLEALTKKMRNQVVRPYTTDDVKKLQGKTKVDHTLARLGANRLRELLVTSAPVRALGAMSGNQAVQQVRAGLKAIYLSGWQVAADANTSGQTYPDQSLYPVDSVPTVVRRINNALLRAEQVDSQENKETVSNWMVPIVADCEAGFGGPLNVFELVKACIEAGASGIHLEDQLASEKKCGHLAGKVLIPTSQAIKNLIAGRLAADVMDVPTVVIARTDAESAGLITSDIDERDRSFIDATKPRTSEGFYHLTGSPMDRCVARALAYAPYADLLWFETSTPNIAQAQEFANRVHAVFPGKRLAYNCSPSFNWKKKLSDDEIANFQTALGEMSYAFQFVTLAGWHSIAHSMFDLARDYNERGMSAYVELQQREFADEAVGYTATKHQREVGTGVFDAVMRTISNDSSVLALEGSTETKQF